jgi:hypothetical protein
LIGIGKNTDSYSGQSLQGTLSDMRNDTSIVSEPVAEEYLYGARTDFADPELISDMLDNITGLITEFYKKNPKEAVFVLKSFTKTMQFDCDSR